MKTKLLLAFLHFFIIKCIASDSLNIRQIGIESGLSNNSVTCIYQDQNHFMWFGSYDGLNRYDGYQVKVFKKQPGDSSSLVFNRITSIAGGKDNRIWIGTMEGVSILDPVLTRFTTLKFWDVIQRKMVVVQGVNVVRSDEYGNVFIGSIKDGLLIYQKEKDSIIQIPHNGSVSYTVTSVALDINSGIWLSIEGVGLCKYDFQHNTISVVNSIIRNITALKFSDSTLYLGTDNGLVFESKKPGSDLRQIASSGYKVTQFLQPSNSKLWIGTDGDGISIFDRYTYKVEHFGSRNVNRLSSAAIHDMYMDGESRIWVGTLRGGLNILEGQTSRFKTEKKDPQNKNSLPSNFVSSFCEDDDHNIWVGTDGGGLSHWNRKSNTFTNYRHDSTRIGSISGNMVTAILRDHTNNLWVATWDGGVCKLNSKSGLFEPFYFHNAAYNKLDRSVWRLFEDNEKNLWASTFGPGGLYLFDRKRNTFDLFDGSLTGLLTIVEDSDGALWAGDMKTLIKIDKKNKQHTRFRIGNRVRAIYEDKSGRFWVGTEDDGLLLFDRNIGTFQRFSEKDGLSSNAILNILEDKRGNLWISTYNGVSRFNPVTLKFYNYSQSDGLQSNQFSYNAALALRSGEMMFGGIAGMNIFFPQQIRSNTSAYPIVISDIRINNLPLAEVQNYISRYTSSEIEEIRLPFNSSAVSISFLAPEYASSDKINYGYYLEGRDDDWIYLGKDRTVNYSGLQEGKYVFRVRASDTDGAWNRNEKQLKIIVLPPWYRSWWAYLLYLSCAAIAIYLYVKYKVQKEKFQYEVDWTKKESEKERELNEKKLLFFTNISHEFRSPLALIINPLKEILHNPSKAGAANDLNIVYRNARRLLSLVDQLLLFHKADSQADKLKVTRQNFSELCREVFSCFGYLAKTKNIQYEFRCENPELELAVDREKMEIILFNLLSNALKFTPDNGVVLFDIEEDEHTVIIKIEDSGCGIDKQSGRKLFERFYQQDKHTISQSGFGIGLFLVKQFVEAHRGTITYNSVVDKGTQFVLKLKKGIAHFNGHYIYEDIGERPLFLDELTVAAGAEEIHLVQPELLSDKKTILLVDDNAEIRQYLQKIFMENFLVLEAENAETGWQLTLQHIPDVIISDVVMGGMTGIEFCRKIKDTAALRHIPVLLLTASSSSEIKLNGIECGADDYITKPFEKDLLIARVHNILKNRSTLQQFFFDKITLQKSNARISGIHKDFLEKCMVVVEKNIDNEEFTIKMLMKEMNLSHSGLYKKIKAISGESVNAFIRLVRLRKAAVLLLTTDINISEAAYKVGMPDVKNFRKQFVKLFGIAPSVYIKKYKDSFDHEYHLTTIQKQTVPTRDKK